MRRLDVVVFFAVWVALLAWYATPIFRITELADETFYVHAFAAVNAGQSPYVPGFVYPYPFALAGAFATRHFGLDHTLLGLRLLNAVGIAAVVATAVSNQRRWVAIPIGVLLVLFAPSVWHGVELGNSSGLAIGLGVVGLLCVRQRPMLAGVLLGLSLVTKPVMLSAWAALAGYAMNGAMNGRGIAGDRRLLRAPIGAAFVAAAALAVRPSLLSPMLHIPGDTTGSGMLSAYRALNLLGVPVAPTVFVVVGALVAAWLGFRRIGDDETLFFFALLASVASIPYLWKHTLLVILPLQVHAFVVAMEARKTAPDRERATLRIALLALANAYLLTAEALPLLAGARWPTAFVAVLILLFDAVPVVLFVSVTRAHDGRWLTSADRAPRPQPAPSA